MYKVYKQDVCIVNIPAGAGMVRATAVIAPTTNGNQSCQGTFNKRGGRMMDTVWLKWFVGLLVSAIICWRLGRMNI